MSNCDTCGEELIDRCFICGAPVCCPRCCAEATRQQLDHLKEIEENKHKEQP